jgi:hypothetical protein
MSGAYQLLEFTVPAASGAIPRLEMLTISPWGAARRAMLSVLITWCDWYAMPDNR